MRIRNIGAALTFVVAGSAGLAAQTAADPDPRWNAWLGCWHLVEERVRAEWDPEPAAPEFVPAKGAVVCVSPAEQPNAVRLTTRVESQSTLADTIAADGTSQPVREPGCEGTQRTEWSSNGLRLFTRAELTCGAVRRTVSGIAMIDSSRMWTDVQVVEEGRRDTIRVRRYRRAADQAQASGRVAALTIEEVKEVAQKLPMPALEAVLLETGASFPLNSKRLAELDEAQVPARIIDLMVALSFPNRFVIDRRPSSGSGSIAYGDPYDWPYYYAPFAYSSFGYDDFYYYGAPGYIVIDDTPPGPQPSGQGRVVDGFGYTRVRSREPVGVTAGGHGGDGSGAGSTGSSTGGGTVSSGGYSGGGGGGDRTAVSRPPR
jgi:uncharacterized membrane protein YgcG